MRMLLLCLAAVARAQTHKGQPGGPNGSKSNTCLSAYGGPWTHGAVAGGGKRNPQRPPPRPDPCLLLPKITGRSVLLNL